MLEAISRPEYASDGFVYFVLTLDRNGHYSKKPWRDADTAFRELSRLSRNFIARLRRMCRRRGWRDPGSAWAEVVEAHRTGWPHVNLLIYAPDLAKELEAERLTRLASGATAHEAALLYGETLEHAVAAGWGVRSSAEGVRGHERMVGYLTKLARHGEETAGELAKLTQLPLAAPKNFRRLRSGTRFLPKRRKNAEITGTLIRRVRDPRLAAYAAEPLVRHREHEIPLRCAQHEEHRMEQEAHARVLARRFRIPYQTIAPPPVESFLLERGPPERGCGDQDPRWGAP